MEDILRRVTVFSMEKYRSLEPQYVPLILKEYAYFTLLLNDDQRYLGRAYLWLVREGGMQRLSEITPEEYIELKKIILEYEDALKSLWSPDFMNYAWLANLFAEHGGHGHMHLIPRYKEARTFAGMSFIDGRWGKNFTPNEELKPSQEVLFQIRDALKEKLSKGSR